MESHSARVVRRTWLVLGGLAILGWMAAAGPALPGLESLKKGRRMSDREQILEHIHSLFRAYLAKDRETICRGHTADWRGFQLPSVRIVRGIDQYMETADRILATMSGTRYEIRDSEVHVFGDIAVVYYIADYWVRDGAGEKRVPLRSVDIYRRETGGWNQCGSNICVIPAEQKAESAAATEARR